MGNSVREKEGIENEVYFEIQHNEGGVVGVDGMYKFPSFDIAHSKAQEFKSNPRKFSFKMNDEHFEYWKKTTLHIVKKTIITKILKILDDSENQQ